MDNLHFVKSAKGEAPKKLYAHVRISVEHYDAIQEIVSKCHNLNNRQVADALIAFALKRVKLIERPLYDLGFDDIGEDVEAKNED